MHTCIHTYIHIPSRARQATGRRRDTAPRRRGASLLSLGVVYNIE